MDSIPDLIMQINGTDVVIPGLAGVIAGGVIYYIIGLASIGRKLFSRWVMSDYNPSKGDIAAYAAGAGLASLIWPLTGAWSGFIKVTKPILATKEVRAKMKEHKV